MFPEVTASEPRQSMNIRLIDFDRIEIYEAGAMLVTLLAYPDDSAPEEERRTQLFGVLCACMVRAVCNVNPAWVISPQLVKPIYGSLPERDCDRGVRKLSRLLRHRMVAARMAYPFLKEAER